MLNVNDDMEELLRRAAENYPLKADGPDFDKVLEGIKAFNSEAEQSNHKSNNKRMLWFLLLLPFAFICNNYYKGNKTGELTAPKAAIESSNHTPGKNSNASKTSGTAQDVSKQNLSTEKRLGDNDQDNDKIDEPSIKKPGKGVATSSTGVAKKPTIGFTGEMVVTNNKHGSRAPAMGKGNTLFAVAKKERRSMQQPGRIIKSSLTNDGRDLANSNKVNNPFIASNTPAIQSTTDSKSTATPEDPTLREVYQDEVKHLELSLQEDKPTLNPATPVTSAQSSSPETKDKKETNKKVYAGLIGGPDISTVKYKSVSKIGYSIGLIAGYKAGKRLSIESGLLWSKRFYKSEGKYFDTKKLPIPAYVKIIDLEGYCQMYELPIGITYQFKTGKKSAWFSAVGLSTYFMKNEDYNYNYLSYGQPNTRYASYDNSANNWFSILNVSIGVNKKIARNALLRIQPYVKIPLHGIGIGSLPVSGAGLQAGIVKSIF